MADITMCTGTGCPAKHQCYRHTAKRGMMQTWFNKVPLKDGKCEHFWDNVKYS